MNFSLGLSLRQAVRAAALVSCLFPVNLMGFSTTEISSERGLTGETISLTGEGFDPGKSYTILIGEVPVSANVVSPEELSFTIPSGAKPGAIKIHEGESPAVPTSFWLEVLREIQVSLAKNLPVNTSAYNVGSVFGDSKSSASPYPVLVSNGETTLVAASNGPESQAFLGIVIDESDTYVITTETTAAAMIFVSPSFFTYDPEIARYRMEAILALPETMAAAVAIKEAVSRGAAFIDDPDVEVALRKVLLAAVDELLVPPDDIPQNRQSSWPQIEANPVPGGFKEDFATQVLPFSVDPRQLSDAGYSDIEFVETKSAGSSRDEAGVPRLGIKVGLGDINSFWKGHPLDHLSEVFLLNPHNFENLREIKAQTGSLSKIYSRLDNLPLDRRIIPGGITFQVGGVDGSFAGLKGYLGVEALTKAVSGQLFDRPGEVYVPADRPGVYLIRTFNGATFFPQQDLIRGFPDRGASDQVMFAENLSLGLIDATMVFLKIRGGGKKAGAREAHSVLSPGDFKGVLKSMVVELYRKGAEGEGFYEAAKSILKKGASKLAETIMENAFKTGIQEESNAVSDAISTIMDWWDLATEEIPQAYARFHYLLNFSQTFLQGPSVKGVETSIFAVGDPFQPKITRLNTLTGPRGSEIFILGRNFSADKNKMLVRFGDIPTSPEDPNAGGPIAEVITANRNFVAVKVPELSNPDGPPIITTISVTVIDGGSDNSARLPNGRGYFTVLSDPVIYGISPEPAIVNGVMILEGSNFNPEFSRNQIVSDSGELKILGGTENELIVRVPNSNFPVKMQVEAHGRLSNEIEFTPKLMLPETGGGDEGWIITVSTSALGNSSDGDITLEEALLLAKGGTSGGGLGRDIKRRPDNNTDTWGTYESDHIFGDLDGVQPGLASADHIGFAENIAAGTINVNKNLPHLGHFDSIGGRYGNNRVTLNGSSAPGDGIVIENGTQAVVADIVFSGFPGAALRISGTSDNVQAGRLFASGTGSGLVIEGTASELFIKDLNFTNLTGHAIHLDGSGDNAISNAQIEYVLIEGAGGDGVLLEGSVSQCRLHVFDIGNVTGNGLHLSGAGVRENIFGRSGIMGQTLPFPYTLEELGIWESSGYGILIEEGASNNTVDAGHLFDNTLGGAMITGSHSSNNTLGGFLGAEGFLKFAEVTGNEGPGITVRAPGTIVQDYNIFANGLEGTDGNHGIWIDTADAHGSQVHAVRIGYSQAGPPEAAPNLGSGIAITNGAHDILIGTWADFANAKKRNFIGGNRDHGIMIDGDGTHDIAINHTDIGRVDTDASILFNFYGRAEGYSPLGNGMHGIFITNGANDVRIGSTEIPRDVQIVDHTEGAGIFISGPDTHNVRVWGTHFGTGYFGEKEGNKVGIHLNDGAHSNIIGMRGSPYRPEYPVIAPDRNFHNTFSGSTHAAILIEDSGGFSGGTTTGNQPPPEPTGANVMINNIIGRALLEPQAIVEPNEVGILLTGDSFANRIGGFDISEQNEIRGCNRAGIELRGISPPIPGLSNRIIGNYITANGGFLDPVDDILAEEFPVGAGILLSEGSSGNIVGGLGAGDKNNISLNIAGIWVEGDENSDAEANNYFQGMYLANSRQAGIVLRNSHGNQIGPYLEVNRNGRLPNTYGGIVLYNSDSNRIVGNWVGTDKSESLIYDLPNRFSGVQLIHSSSNIVGGVHTDRNKILGNLENGILIEGSGSSRNRIYNNNIGVFNDRNRVKKGNPVAGIAFEDGAHDNQVGGVLSGIDPNGLPWNAELPNLIIGNGAGILNNGNGTSGNTFVRNVITQNNGKGIQNINNGNEELPPPLITSASGSLISGTVDPAYIPDGSFVEVFSDGDDEGDQYIGTGIVKDGEFSVKPLAIFGTKVNATVTNFLSGSTSEFGGSSFSIMGFRVSRRHDIPPTTKDIPNNGWSLLASVEFTSVGLPAMVEEIKFRARGSANESSAISTLRVLQDVDGDGQVSASDIILEEGLTFSEDDGELIVEAKMHVPSDSRQTLLLEGMLNGSAAGTQTLIFEVEDANKVKTVGSPVPYPIAESGAFPISSDTLVLFEGTASKSGFSEFMDTVYPGETDPSKIGPNEDPDKDGRSNLREYAEGTHPGVADEPHPFTVQQDFNSLIVTFTERAGITDLKRDLEFSTEPNGWTTANGRILSSTTTLLDNGLLQVSMVIDISDLQVSDIYLRLNRTRLP